MKNIHKLIALAVLGTSSAFAQATTHQEGGRTLIGPSVLLVIGLIIIGLIVYKVAVKKKKPRPDSSDSSSSSP